MAPTKRPVRDLVWRMLHALSCIIPHTPRMTVLMYHAVSDSGDFFAVTPSAFESQMQQLLAHVEAVPLSRAFEHAAGKPVTRDSVAITFDDGYQDFVTNAFPVLARNNIPATLFVLGDAPDRTELGNDLPLMTPAQIEGLAHEPLVSIESHALSHQKLKRLSDAVLAHELTESRRRITERAGTTPRYLAYPKGSYDVRVMTAARDAGYEGALSVTERAVHPGDDRFALPRVQVDAGTTLPLFRAKLSPAADWYYGLWSFFRRGPSK